MSMETRLVALATRLRTEFNKWTSSKGAASGIAPLNAQSIVPDANLPRYVRRTVQTINALPINFANGLIVNFDIAANVTAVPANFQNPVIRRQRVGLDSRCSKNFIGNIMSLFNRLVEFAERIRDEFNSWKQLFGQANGIATLGADGILAASQRPPGGGSVPNASETEAGIIEAATTNEAYNSTDILAITPKVLREFIENLIIAGFTQDAITGDGVTTTFNIFFTTPAYSNLVVAQIKNSATNIVVGDSDVSVRINGDGSIDVIFTTAPANGDEYTVVALTRAL